VVDSEKEAKEAVVLGGGDDRKDTEPGKGAGKKRREDVTGTDVSPLQPRGRRGDTDTV